MNEVTVLRNAKYMISRYGWIQGMSGGVNVGFCSWGAIQASRGVHYTTSDRAVEIMRAVVGEENGCLTNWNDEPGRTKEEVLAAFDKAIQEAESA